MAEDFSRAGKLVAVLLARVSDRSQTLTGRPASAATPVVTATIGRVETKVRAVGGKVVKHIGNSVLAIFDTPEKAVTSAAAIQDEVEAATTASKDAAAFVRIGICLGSMVMSGTDVATDGFETASRLVVLSGAGEILLAANAHVALPAPMQLATRRIRDDATCGTVFEYVWRQDNMTFRPMQVTKVDSLKLEIAFGTHTFELGPTRKRLTIGRTDESDIVINQRHVSREHAEIVLRGDKFVLLDQSTNGTYVRIASGEKFALRREEMTLTGAGRIFLGSESSLPVSYKVKSSA